MECATLYTYSSGLALNSSIIHMYTADTPTLGSTQTASTSTAEDISKKGDILVNQMPQEWEEGKESWHSVPVEIQIDDFIPVQP